MATTGDFVTAVDSPRAGTRGVFVIGCPRVDPELVTLRVTIGQWHLRVAMQFRWLYVARAR